MQLKKEGKFKAPKCYLLIAGITELGSISLGTINVWEFQQPHVVFQTFPINMKHKHQASQAAYGLVMDIIAIS